MDIKKHADKNLTFKCDLDLGPICMNVLSGTSTCDQEHLSSYFKIHPKL